MERYTVFTDWKNQYSKKDRGLRALSRHLPFSPGKYLAQRISFIPWTCLSCWKQLGKGPEKANLAGGGGELQQTGFSTLVDGLNAGCMGPPHPHPQPWRARGSSGHTLHHPFASKGDKRSPSYTLSCPRSVKGQNWKNSSSLLFEILFLQSVAHWTHPNIYWYEQPYLIS